MNTVKLYRFRPDGTTETMSVKCTQSTKFYARLKRTRTLPYAHEVYCWALKNGWSAKRHRMPKSGALRTSPSKVALAVRRAAGPANIF